VVVGKISVHEDQISKILLPLQEMEDLADVEANHHQTEKRSDLS
jgi:hypothetical protein